MQLVDWRDLYARNQAVIERAGGTPCPLPAALQRPSPLHPGRGRLPRGVAVQPPSAPARRRLHFDVHVPRCVEPGTAVPLVCMLHGCTQDAAGFAAATRMSEAADRHGFVVVYPEQDRGQNLQACWNWFLPEHQARGAGEPAAIAAIVQEIMGGTSRCAIDGRRVFVAGLSAGGAMATILAATYPEIFAAVAVHSGLAYRSATNLGDAFAAMARGADRLDGRATATHARAIPSIVIHGTADRTVAPVNGRQVLAQSMAVNRASAPETCGELDITRPATVARGRLDGGHSYIRTRWTDGNGNLMHEHLEVQGLGHAWSGGAPGHDHSDPRGPNAADAIWRFFHTATAHRRRS